MEIEESINKFFSKIWFPLAVIIAFFVMISFFSASIMASISFFLLFFFPGYLVASLWFESEFAKTVFSFPLSLSIVLITAFLLGLFSFQVVNIVFLIIINLIVLLVVFFIKRLNLNWKVDFKEPSTFAKQILILLILIVFVQQTFYMGGSLNRSFPQVPALDRAFQLSQLDWMVESETTTLSPWLHDNTVVFTAWAPPISLIGPALLSKAGLLTPFNAQDLFQVLLFPLIILGLFYLLFLVFDERTAILSSIFLAFPVQQFFIANLAGMVRIHFGLLFLVFLFLSFFLFWKERRFSFFLGLFMLGLALAHTPDLSALFVMFLFTLVYLLIRKLDFSYLKHFLIIGLIFSLAFLYFIPAFDVFGTQKFSEFKLISIEEFEAFIDSIGPLMRLHQYVVFLFLFIPATLILLGMILKESKGKLLRIVQNQRFIYLILALYLAVITTGITSFLFEYNLKLRYVFYAFFLAPPAIFLIGSLADKIAEKTYLISKKTVFVILTLLIVLISAPNILTNFNKSYYFDLRGKISEENYPVIQWIKENTEKDATFLSINDFFQSTNVLSDRPSAYLTSDSYNYLVRNTVAFPSSPGKDDIVNTKMNLDIRLTCIDGFVFKLTGFEASPCSKKTLKIYEFDYVEYIDYEDDTMPYFLGKQLKEDYHYEEVYSQNNRVILKKS